MCMLSHRATLAMVHIPNLQLRGRALMVPGQMTILMASSIDETQHPFFLCMCTYICISLCMQCDVASDQHGTCLEAQKGEKADR